MPYHAPIYLLQRPQCTTSLRFKGQPQPSPATRPRGLSTCPLQLWQHPFSLSAPPPRPQSACRSWLPARARCRASSPAASGRSRPRVSRRPLSCLRCRRFGIRLPRAGWRCSVDPLVACQCVKGDLMMVNGMECSRRETMSRLRFRSRESGGSRGGQGQVDEKVEDK